MSNVHDGHRTLWRYMSFERFKDLIKTSTLYFPNLGQFSDFNESELPAEQTDEIRNDLQTQGDLTGEVANACILMNRLNILQSCYANCWTLDTHESNLHWRAYGGGGEFKVAILTTVGSLLSALNTDEVYAGTVQYGDAIAGEDRFLELAFRKRVEYRGEREFRLLVKRLENLQGGLVSEMPCVPVGIIVEVDVNEMIQAVVFEPPPLVDSGGKNISVAFRSGTALDADRKRIEVELKRRHDAVGNVMQKLNGGIDIRPSQIL